MSYRTQFTLPRDIRVMFRQCSRSTSLYVVENIAKPCSPKAEAADSNSAGCTIFQQLTRVIATALTVLCAVMCVLRFCGLDSFASRSGESA